MQAAKNVPPDVARAVIAAFPKSLMYKVVPAGNAAPMYPYHACATMVEGGDDGEQGLVAAAFTGPGTDTEIAMLEYSGGNASVVDVVPSNSFFFPGGDCTASTVDLANPLDSDNSNLAHAIKVSFEGADWYFLWNGNKLIDITAPHYDPHSHGLPYTAMANTYVVDVDHSGPMQITGANGDSDNFPRGDGIASTGTVTLFRYNGTRYAPAEKYRYFGNYTRAIGSFTDYIDMHRKPAPTYLLTIVNGARDGSRRAKAATITLNGLKVLGPEEINQSAETVSKIVELQHKNTINVDIKGPKNVVFYVTIRKSN
jgi:hypothetical protein